MMQVRNETTEIEAPPNCASVGLDVDKADESVGSIVVRSDDVVGLDVDKPDASVGIGDSAGAAL